MITIYLVMMLNASGIWQPFVAMPTIKQAETFIAVNTVTRHETFEMVSIAYQEKP